mgnify:CR=1 FL=1
MGRTVYGVDLEESPFGGLIRKLLTEEELDMIADGGTAAGHGAAPDGGRDGERDGNANSDDADADGAAGETDDPDESAEGTEGDAVDEDDWSVSDETYGSSREVEEADESPTGSELSDSLGGGPSSSPPPSTAPDDRTGYGSADSGGYGGSSDFGDGFDEFDDYEDDSGGVGGFLSAHKWLLLKVAVGLAALAAVGVVVWRYKDKLSGAVPGRGGEDADEGVDSDLGSDVSPARHRAKVDDDAGETPPPDGRDHVDADGDERTAPAERKSGRPSRDRTEEAGSLGEDVDMGALVGLGTLAVIAALVRKFDEDRNRPHDPLVDGPLDEDEDVADDDQ